MGRERKETGQVWSREGLQEREGGTSRINNSWVGGVLSGARSVLVSLGVEDLKGKIYLF